MTKQYHQTPFSFPAVPAAFHDEDEIQDSCVEYTVDMATDVCDVHKRTINGRHGINCVSLPAVALVVSLERLKNPISVFDSSQIHLPSKK